MTDYMNDVLEMIDTKRKEIKPAYERGAKPVYGVREYAELTDLDAGILKQGGVMNLAEKVPTFGVNGNMLRTPRTAYAANLSIVFDNRVKVDTWIDPENDKEQQVYVFVIDQEALLKQKTGKLGKETVTAYVVGKKKGNTKAIEVKEVRIISEKEFLSEFTSSLDIDSMEEVMDVINQYKLNYGSDKVIKELQF